MMQRDNGEYPPLPFTVDGLLLFWLAFALLLALVDLLDAWFPALVWQLRLEDGVVETLSMLAFFAAFLVGAVRLLRKEPRAHKLPLALIALLGLLGFLDEISYGERLFHFPLPTVGLFQVDGLHDFVKLLWLMIESRTVPPVVARLLGALALGALVGAGLLWRRYRTRAASLRDALRTPPILFVASAVALVLASLLIDLDWIRYNFLFVLEEIFEMGAGVALLMGALSSVAPAVTDL